MQLSSPNLNDLHASGLSDCLRQMLHGRELRIAKEKGESIFFLKQQQWAMEFATETAEERTLRQSLKVPGEIRPRTGGRPN